LPFNRGNNTLYDSIRLFSDSGIDYLNPTDDRLALLPFPCLPAVKDYGNIMPFSLPVIDEGIDQNLPLLPEISVIDTDYVVSINNY
jgi:hypothetical protein